jgi:hypothetical protein
MIILTGDMATLSDDIATSVTKTFDPEAKGEVAEGGVPEMPLYRLRPAEPIDVMKCQHFYDIYTPETAARRYEFA